MAIVPTGPYAEAGDGIIRLHASAKWIEIAGVWTAIEGAVTVDHDPQTGEMLVECVDGRWISMKPIGKDEDDPDTPLDLEAHVASIYSTGDKLSKMGQFLDPVLSPRFIKYKILHSTGLSDGGPEDWILDAPSGVGLHIHDLWVRFAGRISFNEKSQVITIDLRESKDEAVKIAASLQPSVVGEAGKDAGLAKVAGDAKVLIDLDPSVLASSGVGSGWTVAQTLWADARNIPDKGMADAVTANSGVNAAVDVPEYGVGRGVVRFKTDTVLGTPISALLTVTSAGGMGGGLTSVSLKATPGQDLSDPASYATSEIGTPLADTLSTTDLTSEAISVFSKLAAFDLMLTSSLDVLTAPSNSTGQALYVSAATLTLKWAAPTGAITAVAPDPRTTPAASITIVFNGGAAPIDPASFTKADLAITRDAAPLDISGAGVTLTTTDDITWTLAGLTALSTPPGSYSLAMNMAGITNPYGDPGSGTVTESWTTTTAGHAAKIVGNQILEI